MERLLDRRGERAPFGDPGCNALVEGRRQVVGVARARRRRSQRSASAWLGAPEIAPRRRRELRGSRRSELVTCGGSFAWMMVAHDVFERLTDGCPWGRKRKRSAEVRHGSVSEPSRYKHYSHPRQEASLTRCYTEKIWLISPSMAPCFICLARASSFTRRLLAWSRRRRSPKERSLSNFSRYMSRSTLAIS